ncbi:MAG: hypothetical protein ACRD0P_23520 [Stackebrandtia sp.]
MNEPLQVSAPELTSHGGNIDAIAGQLGAAAGTAETTSAEQVASAFGALFAPIVVPLLAEVETVAKGFINAAKGTATAQGQAATGLAQTYTDTDEAGRRRLDEAANGSQTPEYPGAQA